ncbi:MAG: cob(I)yrinic acid a,c-diamide adenosyltransferase [Alphaproteobacteria bacterium]|nr:cob(I)yrinic acid a,c-diamide adenosyltransferase [Alphaproteobacteria bacterium]
MPESDKSPDNQSDNFTRHNEKMAKKKQARAKIMSDKLREKGLIIVHTGKGKGKTTAAIGLIFRALGRDKQISLIQFVKGAWQTGEHEALKKFPDLCRFRAMGEGFTWETQDKQRDIDAARKAWEFAKQEMNDPDLFMLVLDELNIVLRYDYLPLDEVLESLKQKRDDLHIVITGRNAPDRLIDIADLVTEMTQISHPFRDGIKAQIGIEF